MDRPIVRVLLLLLAAAGAALIVSLLPSGVSGSGGTAGLVHGAGLP